MKFFWTRYLPVFLAFVFLVALNISSFDNGSMFDRAENTEGEIIHLRNRPVPRFANNPPSYHIYFN